jgi:hypothetical protein
MTRPHEDPSAAGENDPPVGIVVHDVPASPPRPRSFAFVWAGEDYAAPSLPFGRWNRERRSAAG